MVRVPKDALRLNGEGQTVAACATCGTDTVHARLDHVTTDYGCLQCQCAALGGAIPLHGLTSGAGFRVNQHNGIGVMLVHYSANPDKNPQTEAGKRWVERERRSYASRPHEWNKLYEIDFWGAGGPRIYPEFNETLSYQPSLEVDPDLPVMAIFDFGIRHPAAVWMQWQGQRLNILAEMLGFESHIEHFYGWVNRLTKALFLNKMGYAEDEMTPQLVEKLQDDGVLFAFGDQWGGNQQDRHQETDIMFARKFGWKIGGSTKTRPQEKIKKVRSLTVVRADDDGQPRLFLNGLSFRIDSTNPPRKVDARATGTLLAGFLGGYHWKQDSRGVVMRPAQPDKDIHSHLADCVQDGVDNTFEFETGHTDMVIPRRVCNDPSALPERNNERVESPSMVLSDWYFRQAEMAINQHHH